jgi:hypothetical protein
MSNLPPASDHAFLDETRMPARQPKPGKPPKAPKTKATKATKTPRARRSARTPGRASGCLGALFNLLTLLFLVLTCLSAGLVAALFQDPSPLRFVPGGSVYLPATDLPIAQVLLTPTPPPGTPGQIFPTLPPVWTPTDTPTITPTPAPGTPSPEPSSTLAVPTFTATWTATPTATSTKPSPTPTKTGPTPKPTYTPSKFRYTLQSGSPTYLANFLNTSGCNWFGIVGRVFGLDSNPVINLTVHLEGGGINADVVTGSGPSALGPGGYQIPLGDHPIDTTDTYHVQLRNNSGNNQSDVYSIRTYGDCARNMVMVNFTQNH